MIADAYNGRKLNGQREWEVANERLRCGVVVRNPWRNHAIELRARGADAEEVGDDLIECEAIARRGGCLERGRKMELSKC